MKLIINPLFGEGQFGNKVTFSAEYALGVVTLCAEVGCCLTIAVSRLLYWVRANCLVPLTQ